MAELFGFFGVRRHAQQICDKVEDGQHASWEACLLLKDGESADAITTPSPVLPLAGPSLSKSRETYGPPRGTDVAIRTTGDRYIMTGS